ncbi:MAG TPA: hypothetical protein VH500_06205 [Nitrososphaeraceae archaeon]
MVAQFVAISAITSNVLTLTENSNTFFNNIALPTFALILLSIVLIVLGLRSILISYLGIYDKSKLATNYTIGKLNSTIFRTKLSIASIFRHKHYPKIFWISTLCYFILFLFSSNTVVYRQNSGLSLPQYNLHASSVYVIGCCGTPGSFPVITFILTDNLGFVLIPISVILSVFLSILVGLNISLSCKSITVAIVKNSGSYNSRSKRGISCSLLGASTGLFTACPTCAVNFIFILIGTGVTITAAGSSVSAAAVAIGRLQPLFIAMSLIALIVGPLIITRYSKL